MIAKIIKRMISVGSAFVIFGIIDNGVMVVSGSLIEDTLGHALNISAMASAGLGNTLSDIVGIICGRYIEKYLYKIMPIDESVELTKFQNISAEAIGITVGCLLGMIPLFFM